MKVIYSDKKVGKTFQIEVPKENEAVLLGKKVGETIEGASFNMPGFKLQITGLSDKMGTPSRREVEGTRKAYVLLSGGTGVLKLNKGKRVRRLVRGNTISTDTSQVNTVIMEYGSKSQDELFPKKEKKEEAKAPES